MSKRIQSVSPERDATDIQHIEQAVTQLKDEDPHKAALEDNPEHAEKLSWSTCFAVLFLALSYVGPVACGLILPTAILVQIGEDLGNPSIIVWIVGGGALTSSITLPIGGQASDIFGRRWTVLGGQITCIVAAVVGATAKTTLAVVIAGAINGLGIGFVFVSYAGIEELLPNKWRGFGLGFTETCMTVPWVGANVLIATLLASRTAAGWRWIYYIGLMYDGISIVGNFLFYFPPSRPQQDYVKTRWQQLKEQDYIGIVLYAAGLAAFLIGITWAGAAAHPWKSASTLAPLVVGAVVFFSCFAYEFTLAKNPIFPWFMMRQWRDYTIVLVVIFVSGMVYFSMAALLPQATLYIFTSDPIEIGIIQLPNGLGQMIFGGLATLFIGKIKHLKVQIITLLVLQTFFIAIYSAVIPRNKAAWMAFQFFGLGVFPMISVLTYLIAGLNVSIKHLGLASGFIGTFRSLGGSVGNAIFTTILTDEVNTQLQQRIAKVAAAYGLQPSILPALIPATVENAAGVPGAFSSIPGITPAIEAALSEGLKDAYAYSFRRVFWSTIPFGVFAIVCAFFINDPSKYLTNHVAVHMEKEGVLGHSKGLKPTDTEKGTATPDDS